MPKGILIFEDPPTHTIHRRLLSRAFSPRRVAELEPKIREFCARCLDPFVGADGLDFIADFGSKMPMQVIGMLLGIPETDQDSVREHVDDNLRTKEGEPMKVRENFVSGEMFADYIEWRAAHPSDDIMTELLNVEFTDETGTERTLTRQELLTYLEVVAGAGNETTNRLIGWTAKLLSDHPEQRAQLGADRSLIPNAIEEILRYEPPGPHVGRCVAREDIVLHGVERYRLGALSSSSSVRPTGTTDGSPTATASTSRATTAATSSSRSATASTSAWVPRWPGSRARSPSTKSSRASPTGRSTWRTPESRPPRPCAASRRCRPGSARTRRSGR
jgi:cytochrome P450